MRTTIDLPDELLKRAKIKAVQEGITLKQLFIQCIERELGGGGQQGASKSSNTSTILNPPATSASHSNTPSFRSALRGGSKVNINPKSSGFGSYKGPGN